MRKFVRPKILASKCLGFSACRYNGVAIPDVLIEKLKPFVEYQTVCPEVEIGLGVPRDPIRIVSEKGNFILYQPSTDKEFTDQMESFSEKFLSTLKDIDGFILKFKSPSCGLKDVKIYPNKEKGASLGKTSGFFGRAVIEHFPDYPIEDEGRLKNFAIREHFLAKLFTFAEFNRMKKTPNMGKLVEFHAQNKLLYMMYSQKELKAMGQFVANHEKLNINDIYSRYEKSLLKAFEKPPRIGSTINVLQHAFGYFSKEITKKERAYYVESLEKYKEKKIPLSVVVGILKSYLARFNIPYLTGQTFFEPFPEELIEVTDSGKGRPLK